MNDTMRYDGDGDVSRIDMGVVDWLESDRINQSRNIDCAYWGSENKMYGTVGGCC